MDHAPPATGAVLIAGTASGVGKSTVAAGLCRSFARRGARVAPFKAQNMSNHAAVTSDGGEIGRAQAMQALAAGVEATVDMNPILIKPGPDMTSHVVVRGREVDMLTGFEPLKDGRRDIVLDSYRSVADSHDLVVAEGAGGAAEINLLDRDLVNLPFANAAGIPSVVVVDIDRGGAFAAAYGTITILPDDLRRRIKGIIINSFRGDPVYLGDGMNELERLTNVPVLGVLPHLGPAPLLGVEDSLDIGSHPVDSERTPTLRVAVVALPHLANPSDLDPLTLEPGVALTWARRPADLLAADLVVIPGSRATVNDLAWLNRSGMAAALQQTDAHILGICGGFQMLGHRIDDPVESRRGVVDALGLLDVDTVFTPGKIVRQSSGTAHLGGAAMPVTGYQIRFGRPVARSTAGDPFLRVDGEDEGAMDATGRIAGTSLHGIFDSDTFRTSYLRLVARAHSRDFTASEIPFASQLDQQHERLADWVDADLAMDRLVEIAADAAPSGSLPGW